MNESNLIFTRYKEDETLSSPTPTLHRGTFLLTDVNLYLGLTEESILVFEQEHSETPSYCCPLTFEVKCQIIYTTPQQAPFGAPLGIILEKQNCVQKVQLRCTDALTMAQWAVSLERLINQRGFHRLFNAKRKIGKGAFATVYLVERLRDGKPMAAKAFSKMKQFSTAKGRLSIENQVRLMRKLDHPNVVRFQGIYETENSIYIILEYLKGPQLNALFTNKLNEGATKKILRNILLALIHLEEKGIVHRDLKPDNIIMRDNEEYGLAICDFGLAIQSQDSQYLFVRCGTPGFVSPQILNISDMSQKINPISDVFSVGVIFHYLLLGRSIFRGKKCPQIVSENRRCAFDFTQECYMSLNPHAFHLMQRMLEKNPLSRISARQALQMPFFTEEYGQSKIDIELKDETNTVPSERKVRQMQRILVR